MNQTDPSSLETGQAKSDLTHQSDQKQTPQATMSKQGPPGESVMRKPTSRVFDQEELLGALMPTLEALYQQDPECLPFRTPVNPEFLGIPDYFDIIKNPMDLSTIFKKLDTGQYKEPWQYVEDVWLMFNNAWLYNPKTSRVYKYCTKLAEVFEFEIDYAMRSLGYCCGRKYSFSPRTTPCDHNSMW